MKIGAKLKCSYVNVLLIVWITQGITDTRVIWGRSIHVYKHLRNTQSQNEMGKTNGWGGRARFLVLGFPSSST